MKLKQLTTLEIWVSKLKRRLISPIYNDAKNEVGPMNEHIFHVFKIKALKLISEENSVQNHVCTSHSVSQDCFVKSKQASTKSL